MIINVFDVKKSIEIGVQKPNYYGWLLHHLLPNKNVKERKIQESVRKKGKESKLKV